MWLPEYLATSELFEGHFVFDGRPPGAALVQHNHQAHVRHLGRGDDVPMEEPKTCSAEWLQMLDGLDLPYGGEM